MPKRKEERTEERTHPNAATAAAPHSKPAAPCSKHEQVLNEGKLFQCWLHIHKNNLKILFLCKSHKSESLSKRQTELLQLTPLYGFFNLQILLSPDPRNTLQAAPGAHERYGTLNSSVSNLLGSSAVPAQGGRAQPAPLSAQAAFS